VVRFLPGAHRFLDSGQQPCLLLGAETAVRQGGRLLLIR
jgi:hypothetical protein